MRRQSILEELDYLFPLHSAASTVDKLFLLGAMRLVRRRKQRYACIEVGSLSGDSLPPLLRDPSCKDILAVNDAQHSCANAGGLVVDAMNAKLRAARLDVGKLDIFPKALEVLGASDSHARLYDLALVDARRCDDAGVARLSLIRPVLKKDAVVVFSNVNSTDKTLDLIRNDLDKKGIDAFYCRKKDSRTAAVVLGSFQSENLTPYFGVLQAFPGYHAATERVAMHAGSEREPGRLGLLAKKFFTT